MLFFFTKYNRFLASSKVEPFVTAIYTTGCAPRRGGCPQNPTSNGTAHVGVASSASNLALDLI